MIHEKTLIEPYLVKFPSVYTIKPICNLQTGIKYGQYSSVHPYLSSNDIDLVNFEIGDNEITAQICYFNTRVEVSVAHEILNSIGFRAANAAEFLGFNVSYPSARKLPGRIIALPTSNDLCMAQLAITQDALKVIGSVFQDHHSGTNNALEVCYFFGSYNLNLFNLEEFSPSIIGPETNILVIRDRNFKY